MSSLVEISVGPITLVRLNRPAKRNAINGEMIRSIRDFFRALPNETKAIIFSGAGDHFCGGLDLAEHQSRDAEQTIELSETWYEATNLMQFGKVPVLAVLQGGVIGGGLELATACHVRIADQSAFYALPEARRGIFVGGGASVRVSRIVGPDRMTELMLTGRRVNAEEGMRLGLSHYLVDPGAALPRARELASVVIENSPLSNLIVLKSVQRIAGMGFAEGLFTESLATALTQGSSGAATGTAAFLEKRASRID